MDAVLKKRYIRFNACERLVKAFVGSVINIALWKTRVKHTNINTLHLPVILSFALNFFLSVTYFNVKDLKICHFCLRFSLNFFSVVSVPIAIQTRRSNISVFTGLKITWLIRNPNF